MSERVTWMSAEFKPEFHYGCDQCDALGHKDADGWEYNPETGEMLCVQCANPSVNSTTGDA